MPFHLDIPDREQGFLDSLPLSPEAKQRINELVVEFIANVPDDFRLDPANRPKPDSPYFLVSYIILDRWGEGQIHSVDFHIKDDKAMFGALLIVLIDHR